MDKDSFERVKNALIYCTNAVIYAIKDPSVFSAILGIPNCENYHL